MSRHRPLAHQPLPTVAVHRRHSLLRNINLLRSEKMVCGIVSLLEELDGFSALILFILYSGLNDIIVTYQVKKV